MLRTTLPMLYCPTKSTATKFGISSVPRSLSPAALGARIARSPVGTAHPFVRHRRRRGHLGGQVASNCRSGDGVGYGGRKPIEAVTGRILSNPRSMDDAQGRASPTIRVSVGATHR